MDKDKSFRAVELVVPKEMIDKELKKQINPEWEAATFQFDGEKCVKKQYQNEEEATKEYQKIKGEKMLVQKGNVAKQEGDDQTKLE